MEVRKFLEMVSSPHQCNLSFPSYYYKRQGCNRRMCRCPSEVMHLALFFVGPESYLQFHVDANVPECATNVPPNVPFRFGCVFRYWQTAHFAIRHRPRMPTFISLGRTVRAHPTHFNEGFTCTLTYTGCSTEVYHFVFILPGT